MKKFSALFLACVMLLAFTACQTSNTPAASPSTPVSPSSTVSPSTPVTTSPSVAPSNTDPFYLPTQAEILAKADMSMASGSITIGDTTELNGDFMAGWTNIAANARIKEIINGYSTVAYTEEGTFIVDPVVVKEWTTIDYADGSKGYQFTIYDNLKFSDGTPITATDYVFSLMLANSKEFAEVAPGNAGGDVFVGYDEYVNGGNGHYNDAGDWIYTDKNGADIPVDENGAVIDPTLIVPCRTFSGVHLLGQYTFSVVYKASELPFFYELAGAGVGPYPMHVMAPGVTIQDNGKGCTISTNFTVELLQQTLLDPVNGYRYKPSVTAGPYKFYSFDKTSRIAIVKADPYFLANYDGSRPSIETIILKKVVDATMIDELSVGQVDLISGISGGEKIEKGLDVVDANKAAYHSYPRAGYGKIAFHCDKSPTQFAAVRQAVAYCLDRDEFARTSTKGYGIVVDGYYGASQWEYVENKDELEDKLNHYTYNLDKAKQLLIDDGWTLNSSGGAYTTGVRYKKVGNDLMELNIKWFATTPNAVSDLINTMLLPEVEKIGMKIEPTFGDFPTLITNYYRDGLADEDVVYTMFNLGTGFATMNSPWYYYDPKWFGEYNTNFIDDKELYDITQDMKKTSSTDREGWSKKWVDMEVRWNELMPDIPLYSDLYHDFYSTKLENFRTSPLWGWSYAIQRANLAK